MAKIDVNYINGSYVKTAFKLSQKTFFDVNYLLNNKFLISLEGKVKNSVSRSIRGKVGVIPVQVNKKTPKKGAEDDYIYHDLLRIHTDKVNKRIR